MSDFEISVFGVKLSREADAIPLGTYASTRAGVPVVIEITQIVENRDGTRFMSGSIMPRLLLEILLASEALSLPAISIYGLTD